MDAWATHNWLNPDGRRLDINGQLKRGYFCRSCKRRFVELVASGERFAAYASAFDFERLAQGVTERWLSEPCPGQEQEADLIAYRTRVRV